MGGFEAAMLGVLIHAVASHRPELRATGLALEREVTATESAFVDRPSPEIQSSFMEAQKKYELHLTEYIQKRFDSEAVHFCGGG